MFEKLELVAQKYQEINEKLQDPDITRDNRRYRELMKECKTLTPVVEKFAEYNKEKALFTEAKEILSEPGIDRELKAMAQDQYDKAKERVEEAEAELKLLLLPKDPNDEKNVIIEIRGGAGGEEAMLFAASLFRMYSMYAERKRWKLELLDANIRELGGLKEASFLINGCGAYSRLKFESGVHRVQRVPETEASGRIHTSTVTVAVLPEAEEVDVEINTADLQIDTFRASGAGGQHINKTESAIRITHMPTGLVVECQDERSQHKNKDRAMKVLRAKLYDRKCQEQSEKIANQRRLQVGSGDRSERIRTYNFPQGRVTDHRIGLTLYKLDEILNGSLDEIIDQLTAFDQAEKLRLEGEF